MDDETNPKFVNKKVDTKSISRPPIPSSNSFFETETVIRPMLGSESDNDLSRIGSTTKKRPLKNSDSKSKSKSKSSKYLPKLKLLAIYMAVLIAGAGSVAIFNLLQSKNDLSSVSVTKTSNADYEATKVAEVTKPVTDNMRSGVSGSVKSADNTSANDTSVNDVVAKSSSSLAKRDFMSKFVSDASEAKKLAFGY